MTKKNIIHIITRLLNGGADENTVFTCNHSVTIGDEVTLIIGKEQNEEIISKIDSRVRLVVVDNLVNNLKSPILVFILVFIMNFGLLNDILLKNVPRFINSTGGMNYLGVAVKALVAAVIYFSLNKLVL